MAMSADPTGWDTPSRPLPAARQSERWPALQAAYAHLQSGRFASAEYIAATYAQDHSDLQALLLLGLAIGCQGRVDAAAWLLADVARANPDAAHPAQDLAQLLQRQGRYALAEGHYRAALTLTPSHQPLLRAWADFLLREDRHQEAEAAARMIEGGAPDALGIALAGQGRMQEAVAVFCSAIADDPDDAVSLANLAKVLVAEGRFPEAREIGQQAMAARPDDLTIQLNYAMGLLKSGAWAEGWAMFERRPAEIDLPPERRLTQLADAVGARILVTHEGGFGDTLQFMRYLPLLAALGAKVIVAVPRPLLRLAVTTPGVSAVVRADRPLPAYDRHIPFMSLACLFNSRPDNVPGQAPYLVVPPALREVWRGHLEPWSGRAIGLVWAGSARPTVAEASQLDLQRSMDPEWLQPLAAMPGITWVSLQKHHAVPRGMRLANPMPGVRDFADTAAIIAGLDWVVTVDTAVAHLAGALGRRVILMDRYENCWRWLSGRSDSVWYPTLRIVRQHRPGDWSAVIQQVVDILSTEP